MSAFFQSRGSFLSKKYSTRLGELETQARRHARSGLMHCDMNRPDAFLIAVNRVWRGCWKLDAKTRSMGSARRDRKEAAVRFDD